MTRRGRREHRERVVRYISTAEALPEEEESKYGIRCEEEKRRKRSEGRR